MTLFDFLYGAGALLFSTGAGAALVLALSSWFGKFWAERVLAADREKYRKDTEADLQRLKDQIERSQFVHRMQFAKEFKLYVNTWAVLVDLQDATLRLRPGADVYTPEEKAMSPEALTKTRLDKCSDQLKRFITIVHKNRPFFPEHIYSNLQDLRHLIFDEAFDYKHCDYLIKKDVREYMENAERNAKEIQQRSDDICIAIRKRIGVFVSGENNLSP